MGVKIVAQDLEKAIAGSALLVAKSEDDIPSYLPVLSLLSLPRLSFFMFSSSHF
jgi:hypothetical protein